MANMSLGLTILGLPARAGFLLVAAALWLVFVPIINICIHVYARVVSLPLTITGWIISEENVPEGHVTSLARNHLLQRRTISGPWSLLRSVCRPLFVLGFIYGFVIYYGILLSMILFKPVYIVLEWALQPLWQGFRDWTTVRATVVERTTRVVLSVSEYFVDLHYEYLQDEWRLESTSSPSLHHRLYSAIEFAREQVWLISLLSIVLNIAWELSNKVSRAVQDFMRKGLESPQIPSLIKTLLSAFIVTVVLAEDELRKRARWKWDSKFTSPANKFVSEVHDTEQQSKREHNRTIYEPLSSSKDMIRVMRILPGVEGQALQCFVHAEQRSSAKYEALSYVWGDPTLRRFIMLNGTRYAIGKNLYDCLLHLRRATTHRELWVDTLCINQANSDERSQQVLLMGDLYKKAAQVVIWLGLDARGVQDLFCEASEHHQTNSNAAKNTSLRPDKSGNLHAIQHVLGSPWWSRVWTVQELILGSSTIVQCGEHSLPWESFCQVIDRNASQMGPADLRKTSYSQYLALKRERQLYRQHVVRRYPLLERMYTFREKQASVAVDKIFGFYGLLDEPSAEIRPEYDDCTEDVEESFAIDFINRYKSLAVIAVAELLEYEDTIPPQWIPHWSVDGSINSKTLFWTGLGDEIGGQPWSEDGFDAAHGRFVRTKCEKVGDEYDHAIELEGWHMDNVTLASAVITSADMDGGRWEPVLEQWLGMACGPDRATDCGARRSEKLRLFYKTITAGLFDEAQSPASLQHAKFVAAVQKACRCRRLFFTSSGRYGLGPQDTACGDEIWILLGMAVPVILGRRLSRSRWNPQDEEQEKPDPDEPFRYLGQAYIDELMRPGNNTTSVIGLSEEDLEPVHIWSQG